MPPSLQVGGALQQGLAFATTSKDFVVFDQDEAPLGTGSFGCTYEGLLHSLPVAAKGAPTLFAAPRKPGNAAARDKALADMRRDLDIGLGPRLARLQYDPPSAILQTCSGGLS